MINAPMRPITNAERAALKADGVVQLKQVLPLEWVDFLRQGMEQLYTSHLQTEENPMERLTQATLAAGNEILSDSPTTSGQFFVKNSPSQISSDLRRFAFDSPLPMIAADLYDADVVNFYFDQLFWKEAGSGKRTAFHQDESYFNCTGDQCCTFWVAVDPVTKANGAMGYVRGSHLWQRQFAANVFVSQQQLPGAVGEQIPDIEANEADYDIVYYDSEPGDVLVHNYRTLHGSTGNVSADRPRRSFAVRYTGDDVRYYQRPGAPEGAPSSQTLNDGDRMDAPDFPAVWRRAEA
ncbi:phytanoyl-CoA dioxygenase PhyH [Hephaestia caeni]|uniref:Phytanoyl-CoA dioxygenase PhyH n=1 Tax=Hephaestia caeni TaxID=645617 RepID=A0A397NKG2_9SPHN|nr:phytanoyl-CoA dioxygenase family protein [Hephaestia caeni]RIA37956.1 phytanoyl-CoA dioxygenase PhyH [Hephaestia caeni]